MVTKKDLMRFCRYYKGTTQCPFTEQTEKMLWFYESAWVNDTFRVVNEKIYPSILSSYLEEYMYAGLSDFQSYDNIPIHLKAYIFHSYAKGAQSLKDAVEPFKKYYG